LPILLLYLTPVKLYEYCRFDLRLSESTNSRKVNFRSTALFPRAFMEHIFYDESCRIIDLNGVDSTQKHDRSMVLQYAPKTHVQRSLNDS
jgi:hypothetical protein